MSDLSFVVEDSEDADNLAIKPEAGVAKADQQKQLELDATQRGKLDALCFKNDIAVIVKGADELNPTQRERLIKMLESRLEELLNEIPPLYNLPRSMTGSTLPGAVGSPVEDTYYISNGRKRLRELLKGMGKEYEQEMTDGKLRPISDEKKALSNPLTNTEINGVDTIYKKDPELKFMDNEINQMTPKARKELRRILDIRLHELYDNQQGITDDERVNRNTQMKWCIGFLAKLGINYVIDARGLALTF